MEGGRRGGAVRWMVFIIPLMASNGEVADFFCLFFKEVKGIEIYEGCGSRLIRARK